MKADATLVSERLVLRHWEDRDRAFFHRINSDPQVMAFYPFRRSRDEADATLEGLREVIAETGMGWAAVTLKGNDAPIGFAGLAQVRFEAAFAPAVEIGWRLAPEFWNKGYATEAAALLLRHGFLDMDLPEIVSFAVWDNHRSTGVMRRIGMSPEPSGDFDHPRVPETHPHLRRHVLYRLKRGDWRDAGRALR